MDENLLHEFRGQFVEPGRHGYGHECAVSFTQRFLRDLPALALNLTLNWYLSTLHLKITFRPQAMMLIRGKSA